MTEEEKLIALKAMVGGSDSDEVLSTYLKLAGRKIINRAYPYDSSVTEVPAQYDTLQCEIAAYMLNKRGAEGQTSHSENGISRSYENADIPSSMLKVVTLKEIATDTKRQADKKEQTIVKVGNRTINDAVTTQKEANGFSFTE